MGRGDRIATSFPEVLGVGLVRFEPASGSGPFSCAATATASFDARLPSLPPATNLCGLGLATAVLEARDSGRSSVVASAVLFGQARIMIQAPLYLGGVVPATIDERRELFIGNIGILVEPGHILATAHAQYPDLPIALTYRDGEATRVLVPRPIRSRRPSWC